MTNQQARDRAQSIVQAVEALIEASETDDFDRRIGDVLNATDDDLWSLVDCLEEGDDQ